MIDIIPAAALASVAVGTNIKKEKLGSKKGKAGSSQKETPESLKNLPEEPKKEPKKRSKFLIFTIVGLVSVIIVSLVFALLNLNKFENYFKNADVSGTNTANEAFKNLDEDEDGLTTLEEMASGTMVFDADTDKDGLPDGFEVKNGLNPLNYDDGSADLDDDKLSNVDEYGYKTEVNNPDTDKDGYQDGEEVLSGFNPAGAGKLVTKKKVEQGEKMEGQIVAITRDRFSPSILKIKKGESVVFENKDTVSHSVSSDEIESGTIEPGKTYRYTFFTIGEYEYYDVSNQDLVGKIIVE